MMHSNNSLIKISGIVSESIVDGEGIRYVIFTQGCYHRCEGCHNPHTHDPNAGEYKPIDDIVQDVCNNPLLKGITLSGGEPFLQAEALSVLATKVKESGKDVWAYTGYTYEELIKDSDAMKLLNYVDVLVDGKFELANRDLTLKFRGSSNQRVIDCQKSLELKTVVLKME